MGIDVSGIVRPRSRTSADRSAQHVHNLPECKKPITYGWQFSTAVALPPTPSSWTYALCEQRVTTETTPAEARVGADETVGDVVANCFICILDRGYDST